MAEEKKENQSMLKKLYELNKPEKSNIKNIFFLIILFSEKYYFYD